MMPIPHLQPLLQDAAEGDLVLTATRRLARHLRRQFDMRMVADGHSAWRTPAIHSADDWLKKTAEVTGLGWRLLPPQAANHLWERVIEADARVVPGLLQVPATTRLAAEAHALLVEYRLDPSSFPLTPDHASFLRWRSDYLDACRRAGWLDPASLSETVAEDVAKGKIFVPGVLWLAGFDDLPPRFIRLAQVFAGQGAAVHHLPPRLESRGELVRVPCTDAREEVRKAACWARRLLEEGEADIGIIVPELEKYRSLIERIFREEIDPEAMLRPATEEFRFNLSLGAPLARQGAVAAALDLLSAGAEIPLSQAGILLRSPYLGGSVSEGCFRAQLDRKLRGEGQPVITLSRLIKAAGPPRRQDRKDQETRKVSLAKICEHLQAACRDREKRRPGDWTRHFAENLQQVGWPGERPMDSRDYQVVKRWREKVLPSMAAFDLVSGPIERNEALGLLRRLAAETDFHPEGAESPVQVIGLLEAAGLDFRHLWVLGLHDGVLPAPPRPNPFLPVPLQVAAGMPHADAGREGEFARRVAARLFAAAPRVVLSHPSREGDALLEPSPTIREVPTGEVAMAASRAPAVVWRLGPEAAERIADPTGPPLAAGEPVKGGGGVLRDQALCPFRAFARHRLGAAALDFPDIGLDPGERGSLLHKVMEFFWDATKDQAGLLALDEHALDGRLRGSIAAAAGEFYARRQPPPGPLLELERERLRLLLREWLLEVEAKRPPFAVLEVERAGIVRLAGMELRTRLDRLDQLADGSLAVLDYKSGPVEAADLIGERLLEPQLPLYALEMAEQGVAAVAFAALRRGKCGFAGVAREGGLLPRVTAVGEWKKAVNAGVDGWENLLAGWREQLDALGSAFAGGEAAVDPASVQKACRRCDFAPLCRIDRSAGRVAEGEER